MSVLELRPATPEDEPFLLRVYASTREDELALTPWSEGEKQAFLRLQLRAQESHYREHYAGAEFSVVLVDDEPAGRLTVARWPDELRIMDVALLPGFRGRGIGSALLGRVLAEADAAGTPASIHVERHNPAGRLYRRLGFRVVQDDGVYLLLRRPPGVRDAAVPGGRAEHVTTMGDAP